VRIIPAIDLKNGKCVRLFKGDFEQTTEYSNDPVAIARRFSLLQVEELHIVDLDLALQLGGGIRERSDVERWLNAGVSRCVVGSIAIKDPATVQEWITEFGADRIVLALDIRLDAQQTPLLTTHGWTEDSGLVLWDCIAAYREVGAQHVLCTDVDRDGAMLGPNFDLYDEILRRFPGLQLQASGGVRHIADLEMLRDKGVPAAITGRALLDGMISESEVAAFRQNA
jgi:phosphoribosylformimino-5-aminoimidazole carboxamide ribotide isomerase